tara:strand:- start:1356 stop:1697 length:342 start_codon:yes stop_codon:yes gene_type:complete
MTLKEYFFKYEGFYNNTGNTGTNADHGKLTEISANMAQIKQNIADYRLTHTDISNYHNYGNSNEVSEFKTTDRNDALKHDLQYMMGQQQNTYMLGMITIATLGIATFYIARKY